MHSYLIHNLLQETAKTCPDRDAVISRSGSLTYAELHRESDRLARAFICQGVNSGDRVGLMLDKSLESVVSIFGILKTGAAYVPIDPQAPVTRIKYILNSCAIQHMVTSVPCIENMISELDAGSSLAKILLAAGDPQILRERCKKITICPWDEFPAEGTAPLPNLGLTDTSPAYILHTSGSTGLPKGVVISHLNSLSFVNMAADFFGITEKDRLASHAPFHFDLSVFDLFVAVKCGAAIVLVPENLAVFPMKLAQYIEEKKISVWNSVASVVSLLVERGKLDRFDFDSLRLVLFSGDVLPAKHLRQAKALMPKTQFTNIYGQTEANSSICFSINDIPQDADWRIPIGKPFPNFEVFGWSENNKVIKNPGDVGELYIRSSTIAMGYWGDPEKTSKVFVKDPRSNDPKGLVYKTGDLVTTNGQGDYLFIGRRDQQIKSRGYRIQMDEIEHILNNHPDIKEAVVIALPDDLIGNKLIAYASSSEQGNLKENDLFEFCSMFLPRYMLPEVIHFVENLPKTPTGKTDRKRLRETASLQAAQSA